MRIKRKETDKDDITKIKDDPSTRGYPTMRRRVDPTKYEMIQRCADSQRTQKEKKRIICHNCRMDVRWMDGDNSLNNKSMQNAVLLSYQENLVMLQFYNINA